MTRDRPSTAARCKLPAELAGASCVCRRKGQRQAGCIHFLPDPAPLPTNDRTA